MYLKNFKLQAICPAHLMLLVQQFKNFRNYFSVALLLAGLWGQDVIAAVVTANPTNYQSLVSSLKPGDTLALEAGTYTAGLRISGVHGEVGNPIVITGPETGSPAIFEGSRTQDWNTVQINGASYLTLSHLTLDGLDVPFIDAVNAAYVTHHITIENLQIIRHGGDQLTVGIATRGPAWDWIIRNNVIIGAGTGMYLGNSSGIGWPFVGGLIENNLIMDTVGYNIEIKHMRDRNDDSGNTISGMPTEDRRTIIRNNVFSKAIQPSPPTEGSRPNLLVGHFPLSGSGSNDIYEIYGNFFYENQTEALFQGEGNIAMYDNVFYTAAHSAINIQPHNDVPRNIRVFHNTIVAGGTGINVSGVNTVFDQFVRGNAVFAGSPISANSHVVVADNITGNFAAAANYLNNPAGNITTGEFDLYPLAGKLSGTSLDTSPFMLYNDWNLDFNGDTRDGSYRGAYAGEGANPGWTLSLDIKPSSGVSAVAPSIVTQPGAQTVEEGGAAIFSISASGSGPLFYQWRKNGSNISGETGYSYTTPAVGLADNGAVYDCVVTNSIGSINSNAAVLTVTADSQAPSIQSVSAASATTVVVVFSEPVEPSSAEDSSNYSIDGGVSVQSAVLTSDTSVHLSVSDLTDASTYTLTISNVRDLAQMHNTIAPLSNLSFSYQMGEDFESGSANWAPLTGSRWEVILDTGDNAYHLNTSSYDGTSGDGLGEYSLLGGSYSDFELTLDARLGDDIAVNPQADFAIIFGYQDANNYYYMMFNNDATYSQLYKVVNGTRQSVASSGSDWLNDNNYHNIGITRSGNEITVSFDTTTVLTVTDSTFEAGQVGVGSLNDAAYFDNVVVIPVSSGGSTGGGSGGTGGGTSAGGSGTDTGGNTGASSGQAKNSDSGGGSVGLLSSALLMIMAYARRRMYSSSFDH